MTRKNIIKTPKYNIVIQSCDRTVANVGVFEINGKIAYNHIRLHDFKRIDTVKGCHNQLDFCIYDDAVKKNKNSIMKIIEKLLNPALEADTNNRAA